MDYINFKNAKVQAQIILLKAGESPNLFNVSILLLKLGGFHDCFQNHTGAFTDYHGFMIL